MAKKTALIVDDSRLARLTLAKLLSKKDFIVKEAESVNVAYELLNDNKDDLPDMIFMDINMPEVDGIEGVKIIKANDTFTHIPCAMYSSEPSVEIQKKATMVGAQAYLYKPANEEDLDEVLKLLLEKPVPTVEAEPEDAPVAAAAAAGGVAPTATVAVPKALRDNIQVIDRRTKNLARILMQERKENAETIKNLTQKLEEVSQGVGTETNSGKDLETQRLENDLMGQIKTLQGKLGSTQMLTYAGLGGAVLAIILAIAT